MNNQTDIIAKLREELLRRQAYPGWYSQVIRVTECGEILNFLDSLSPQKNNTQSTIKVPPIDNTFTPTPWELIEVSNDGEKWKRLVFVEYANQDDKSYFMCNDDNPHALSWFEFARPITPSTELPDFNWWEIRESTDIWIDVVGLHLEKLTSYLKSRENIK